MIEPGIDTHLEMSRSARGMEVRAYVAAAPPRPLRWRLETAVRGPGGSSNVSQSGTVQGGSERPVSVTSVSTHSVGTVILTVFDGAQEVARDEVTLDPGTGD